MATLSILVPGKSNPVINTTTIVDSNCYQEYNVLIDVTSGNKHVTIIANGQGASPNISEIISADKTYTVYLNGFISSDSVKNIVNSSVNIIIRENNSTGQVVETVSFQRNHTGNIC